jgi:hypothetical protein
VVGLDIAQALGQAQKITRLYNAFRSFAVQAYNSLLALLGNEQAKIAAVQVLEWVDDLRKGELFAGLLEKLYETKPTGEALTKLVTDSQADLARFTAAITSVDALNERYRQQTQLADKLLAGLGLLGLVPGMALPQGKLLMAAATIVLAAYVILAGADYVDAQRLKLLNRVPGVREVVQTNVGT